MHVVPRQGTPEETVAALTPLVGELDELRARAVRCIAQIELAKQQARAALQGAEPGPMLAGLEAIQQVLGAVNVRVLEIRRHVEQAVIEARRIGDGGKASGASVRTVRRPARSPHPVPTPKGGSSRMACSACRAANYQPTSATPAGSTTGRAGRPNLPRSIRTE
ncbi:DUF6244 family protein [Polymorphospora rubra]|uniref:DUF6244 family protein n=1 Tax=Polymorphospora rubra TaxID=338584 RepID=UPI0033F64E4F